MQKNNKLEAYLKLRFDIKHCRKCKGMNIKNITENAPGYGNLNSPIMLIGQSLCTICMKTQIPFTGGSGLILDKIFKKCKIRKKDLFITNLVHCHPINNRPNKPQEIENCIPYLNKEIEIVNPLTIIGFGKDVCNYLLPTNVPFNQPVHWFGGSKLSGRYIIGVYHPAYYWRRGGLNSKETKQYINFLTEYIERFI